MEVNIYPNVDDRGQTTGFKVKVGKSILVGVFLTKRDAMKAAERFIAANNAVSAKRKKKKEAPKE